MGLGALKSMYEQSLNDTIDKQTIRKAGGGSLVEGREQVALVSGCNGAKS